VCCAKIAQKLLEEAENMTQRYKSAQKKSTFVE
jgi:hypothetical protein